MATIKVDIVSAEGEIHSGDATMIFLGDRFLYVDHGNKTYMVMDEAMLEEVSAKVDAAMKEMEAQLASMPPEQRAMVEQMMKGQMQGMMGQAEEAPPLKIEAGGSSEWQSRKCREYEVFEGDEKTQDICAADLDDVDGADEVIAAFKDMAAYIEKMTESMPMRQSGGQPNPGELMEQIDGFPIHTVEYQNGVKVSEVSLDAVTEKDLDDALFGAPEGYRQQDPFRGR